MRSVPAMALVLFLVSPSLTLAAPLPPSGSAPSIVHTNPNHEAHFSSAAVDFAPKSGPDWSWRLQSIRSGGTVLPLRDVPPQRAASGVVRYARGPVVEQYVPRAASIEQQFVLEAPLPGDGDLVVEGVVSTQGRFARTQRGWSWRDERGVVSLGDVTVFDARGVELAARMDVTRDRTRITVAAEALARAAYPVTIDPEIGTNDFRISNMGTDGDTSPGVSLPDVVYNSTNDEWLVAWIGFDGTENEVWVQRVDGDGTPLGADTKISTMGSVAGFQFGANNVDLAYNATNNEYLVVWRGDDDVAPLVDDEFEIFGQRLNAATGAEIGADDFRISFMGPNADSNYFYVDNPAVEWDPDNNRYLVVWQGEDNSLGNDEVEIWGRVLDNTGASVSADDTRISNVGTDGDILRYAFEPDVAYDTVNGVFLVVWSGDNETDNAFDIYGQFVTTAGAPQGSDFRISDLGNSDSNTDFRADAARIAFSPSANEFLVVWHGDDDSTGVDLNEIWGQRIDASTGTPTGTNDFRISDMGPAANTSFAGLFADVAYVAASDEWLVVWYGDELTDQDIEIYGQRLSLAGAEIGTDDFRLSDMGPDGSGNFFALYPAVSAGTNASLIVWRGDDDTAPLVDDEAEVFGQLFAVTPDVSATKVDALFTDADADTFPSAGDTLEYTITITNNGESAATGVAFSDTPDANTSLVVGSVTTSAGSVVTGNTAGNTTVAVNVGTIASSASVTITFRVLIPPTFPINVTSVSNQGQVSGSNFTTLSTDDPDAGGSADATVTAVDQDPVIQSTKAVTLFTDNNTDGAAGPGDVLEYTIVISNSGGDNGQGTTFTDTPDANTALIVGSVTTDTGSVTTGNTGGDTAVAVNVGTVGPGSSATITFRVTIDDPLPGGVTQISNQGTVSGSNFTTLPTDDGSTASPSDATVISLGSPELVATKTSVLFTDLATAGVADRGDTLEYTIVVTNNGTGSATGVSVTDGLDPNVELVVGSVTTSSGSVTTGNNAGDTTVAVNVGALAPAASVTITYRVVIDPGAPLDVTSVSNQGVVSSSNVATFNTDDPGTGAAGDATVVVVAAASFDAVPALDPLGLTLLAIALSAAAAIALRR